jgi:hypothetical protein
LLPRISAAVVSAAALSGVPARASMLANRALAEADTKHFVEQTHHPFEPDRLGDVEVEDQSGQIRAKRRARRHPGGGGALKPRRQPGHTPR